MIAADHRHRVRVAPEAAEEIRHLLVQHGVVGDAALEVLELGGGRQLAVEQQVGDLEEVRLVGQLLDRVAAVEQLALVAVDIGDRALAGAGRGVAGVEGEDAAFGIEAADVDDVGPDRAVSRSAARGSCLRWRAWRCGGPGWSCVVPFASAPLPRLPHSLPAQSARAVGPTSSSSGWHGPRTILEPGKALLAAEDLHHVEDARRDRPAGQRRAQAAGRPCRAQAIPPPRSPARPPPDRPRSS